MNSYTHLFAHNGVDHASAAEAATHSSSQTVLIVVLVSLVVITFMTAVVYLLKRKSIIALPIEDKEDK